MAVVTRIRFSEDEGRRPDEIPEGAVVTVLRVPPNPPACGSIFSSRRSSSEPAEREPRSIVKRSAFDPEGSRLRANNRVFAEQRVLLWREPWDEIAVPTDLPVLYEDEHLFAISKPAGVPVHPTARYHRNTVVKLLAALRGGETSRSPTASIARPAASCCSPNRARPTAASRGSSRGG